MSAQWYCRLMGTEMGPYTSAQLIEMVKSHQLTPEDFVKRGPEGQWVLAERVKGLFEDPASSSIIRASLPPELLEAARQQEQAQQAPAAEPPPVHWFYISEKGKVGPMSFADLATHARDGLLKPGDRVWSSKSPKWSQAQNVEGLNFGPVSNLNSNS